ncbi:MAG TPA: PAS domain S-box protein, partial [Geobacteraceae bacterium]|nr:PAS domain S-box protein [Geobacteraceae bacterium]
AASERRFRAVFEHAHTAIILLDEGVFVDCNPMAEKLFGASKRNLLNHSVFDFSPEGQGKKIFSRDNALKKMRQTLEGIPQFYEWRYQRFDGTVFDVEIGLSPVEVNEKVLLMAILRDITEKKRIEIELRENENKYKILSHEFNALLDAIPDCILLQSSDLEIVWANRAAMKLFNEKGIRSEERHCFMLLHQTSTPHEGCPVLESFATGMPAKGIVSMTDRIWEVRAVPVKDESGETVNVIEIGRDITEMKKLEQQLVHAQKMEAVGQLAGGIAHDFNNIVTAIIGYGNLVLMKLPEGSHVRHFVEQILLMSDRATELTKGLLAFSRKESLNMQPVKLNDIVSGFKSFLERIIGEQIEIVAHFDVGEITIYADSSQIEQVLMNLATNARDAMPNGGALTLAMETVELDDNFVKVHGYGEPGKYVCISVEDTGVGMDENTVKRIFEPFFTTKETGKGTGLGLSIAYGIVKEHSGYILANSSPGNGTTFQIYLPMIQEGAAQSTKVVPYPKIEGGSETILVAEDDQQVREITSKLLSGYGYTVIEAEDGADALGKLAAMDKSVDLLILDVLMPKKGGREVAETASIQFPGIKVLFNSGYPVDLLINKKILPENVNFFTKPIAPRDLLFKVREVLES